MAEPAREYPIAPLVAVGGVVCKGEEVLLVRRGKDPGLGTWSLPGGLVGLGEATEEALRREVREECGIEIEVGPMLGVANRITRDDTGGVRFHYVIIDFAASYLSGEVSPASDISEAAWFRHTDLAWLGLTPAVLSMVERAFAPRQSPA